MCENYYKFYFQSVCLRLVYFEFDSSQKSILEIDYQNWQRGKEFEAKFCVYDVGHNILHKLTFH